MSDKLEEIAKAAHWEVSSPGPVQQRRPNGTILRIIRAACQSAYDLGRAALDEARREDRAEIERLRAEVAQLRYREAGGESSARHALGEAVEQRQAAEAKTAKLVEAQAEARLYRDNAAQAITWFEQLKSERAKTAKLVEALDLAVSQMPDHGDNPCFCWSCNLRETLAAAKASEGKP